MKKIILIGSCLIFSQAALAINPRIMTYTAINFPGAGFDHYVLRELDLIEEAKKFCARSRESLDKISNINMQILADFDLTKNTEGDQTRSTNYPQVVLSALVSCKIDKL